MMLHRHARQCAASPRRGATMIECAFILPLLLLLFAGLAIGAAGVFRYQEVATLAREGARYGSTHGYQYRKDAGLPMGTSKTWRADIYTNAIKPRIVGLDSTRLLVTCSWPDVINQPGRPDNWPGSKIDVTVRYEWMPEGFLLGPYYLTSTSSMPITN
jgi:Flp pilus assembly protein TadG